MKSQIKLQIVKLFNKFYWRQHPEAALRYLPVVSQIKKSKLRNSKILEIGSGSLGIIPYLNKKIDAIDIDFQGPQTDLIKKIKGHAYDLPFGENSYDLTISVDVLEHLTQNKREKAIYEMLRISKKMAIIVVPIGPDAENQDRQLQKRWNRLFKNNNQFLNEHVQNGLPKKEEIITCISNSLIALDKKASVKSFPNLNLHVRKLLMVLWISKNKFLYYLYLKGLLPFVPILKHLNFGKTYRRVFVIEFTS